MGHALLGGASRGELHNGASCVLRECAEVVGISLASGVAARSRGGSSELHTMLLALRMRKRRQRSPPTPAGRIPQLKAESSITSSSLFSGVGEVIATYR